ncbi:hypothetical protein EUGRSUZ_H02482 [Eucalyptus grandis]|uniref:Uncharacterized protein n=2 Tax=Eucalyptus grandis TaxID=71139 RepID=A0ACC3JSP6_EUCGR|nr:hypothetical protein EUGRSUZ_H02482 [Eucalyptus grandis]
MCFGLGQGSNIVRPETIEHNLVGSAFFSDECAFSWSPLPPSDRRASASPSPSPPLASASPTPKPLPPRAADHHRQLGDWVHLVIMALVSHLVSKSQQVKS